MTRREAHKARMLREGPVVTAGVTGVTLQMDGTKFVDTVEHGRIHFTGLNRMPCAAGTTGRIEYRRGPSYGLWFFVADAQEGN